MPKNYKKSAHDRGGTCEHQLHHKKMIDYFEPKLNTTYERYVFNSCDQEKGERFDAYLNKLRKLIKTCRYSTLEDELLCDRIVMEQIKKKFGPDSSVNQT